jgi:hypothetical protein
MKMRLTFPREYNILRQALAHLRFPHVINPYYPSIEVNGFDPMGLDGPLTMSEMLDLLDSSTPATQAGGRLANAQATLCPEDILALTYKESSWDPNAKNPHSTATGLGQILAGTANDIQNRLGYSPSGGGDLSGSLQDPSTNMAATQLYLWDRIAAAGDNKTKGIGNYGEGAAYAKSILAAAAAIRSICGCACGPNKPCCSEQELRDCSAKHGAEIQQALARITHGH